MLSVTDYLASQRPGIERMTDHIECPCSVCSQEVNDTDRTIECDLCEKWCHQTCPGGKKNKKNFSDDLFDLVSRNTGNIAYFCPICQASKKTVFKMFRDFAGFKSEMRKEVDALQKNFHELQNSQLEDLKHEIAELKGAVLAQSPPDSHAHQNAQTQSHRPPMQSFDIQNEVHELFEMEKKKNNCVIVGFPENDRKLIRCAPDSDFVNEVCTKLDIEKSVLDVFRDGRVRENMENGREYSRIMKVKFADNAAKTVFLRNFHKYRPSDARFYVRHDQTARQREQDRALRKVLFDLRNQYKDLDICIVIRDGVIINKATGRKFLPPPETRRPAGDVNAGDAVNNEQ